MLSCFVSKPYSGEVKEFEVRPKNSNKSNVTKIDPKPLSIGMSDVRDDVAETVCVAPPAGSDFDTLAGELVWSPDKANGIDVDAFLARSKYEPTCQQDTHPFSGPDTFVEDLNQEFCSFETFSQNFFRIDMNLPRLCSQDDVLSVLHHCSYDVDQAMHLLSITSMRWSVGVLEDSWILEDMELFEEGVLEFKILRAKSTSDDTVFKRGPKNMRHMNKFGTIHRQKLSHKSVLEIARFYHHWKTLPRYQLWKSCLAYRLSQEDSYDSPPPSPELATDPTPIIDLDSRFNLEAPDYLDSSWDFSSSQLPSNHRAKKKRRLDPESVFKLPDSSDTYFWGLVDI